MTAIKDVEKAFGAGSLMRLGDRKAQDIAAISTGSIALDKALGIGGVPRGRIVEIYGPESAGKTTLVYHILAQAQAEGGTCAFIDAEHAIDPAYAKSIGVNTDDLLINQPDYGEQGLEIADMLVKSGEVDVVAIDSVAALTPKIVLEGQIGETTVGLLARLMSTTMSKLAGNCNRSNTTVVFTNQLRMNINTVGYGPNEVQPGGRALKFYASQRIDLRRIETLKKGEEAIGNRVRAKVVKNKTAPPLKTCEFEITYGKGIDREGELLDIGLDEGTIKRSGAWYSASDGSWKGQGREGAKEALRGLTPSANGGSGGSE